MEKQRQDYGLSAASIRAAWFTVGVSATIQVAWYLVWSLATIEQLGDGRPKQPLRDFLLIAGAAIPAACFLAVCGPVAWLYGRPKARSWRLPFVIALLVASLIVVSVLADWVIADVIHRDEPHGLW